MNVDRYLDQCWQALRYNCWSLVREVYWRELSIELPVVGISADDVAAVAAEFASSPIRRFFQPIDQPVHLCVVGMTQGNGQRDTHCGVWVVLPNGEARVLHNWRGTGVLFEPPERLAWLDLKITGFYHYYA